eukprot:5376879-Amphidinium_carterae.1
MPLGHRGVHVPSAAMHKAQDSMSSRHFTIKTVSLFELVVLFHAPCGYMLSRGMTSLPPSSTPHLRDCKQSSF